MSSNYAEKYPRCANCPRLQELQEVRDETARKNEERVIARDLDIIESEYELELIRQLIDAEYARVLDRVNEGYLTTNDPDFMIAKEVYSSVVAAVEEKDKMKREMDIQLSNNDMVTEMTDQNAKIVAENCSEGPRYRRKTVFCSSVMRNTVTVKQEG